MVGVVFRPFEGIFGCLGAFSKRLEALGHACLHVPWDRPTGLLLASLLPPARVDEDFFPNRAVRQ